MKKLMIATAIAASITSGVTQAAVWGIASNLGKLPGTELWFGGKNLLGPGCAAAVPALAIDGVAIDAMGVPNVIAPLGSAIALTGQATFDASCGNGNPMILLNFRLTAGIAGPTGVTFTAGTIDVWSKTTGGAYAAVTVVNAATTNIPCVLGTFYNLLNPGNPPNETSAGIPIKSGMALAPLPVATNVALPGASGNGVAFINTAACSVNFNNRFGSVATLFMTGTASLF